jgi:SAM-dependent methyltransferase
MWFNSQTCLRAINRKISGDPDVGWFDHALSTYMAEALGRAESSRPRNSYSCLLLGSNEGWMERRLCAEGFVGHVVATDIAENALARARASAAEAGITNVEYVWADLNTARFDGPFDFIVAEGVLHHIERLDHCLPMLEEALAADGVLIMVEFEGPVRFQLDELQTRWINAALAAVPKALRPFPSSSEALYPPSIDDLQRVHFVPPSEEAVHAIDPSEAVSGPLLRQLVAEMFEIVERKGYGGTLLSYMTGHFDFDRTNDDEFAAAWAELLIALEDTLISSGVLADEFVFTVARKRSRVALP